MKLSTPWLHQLEEGDLDEGNGILWHREPSRRTSLHRALAARLKLRGRARDGSYADLVCLSEGR